MKFFLVMKKCNYFRRCFLLTLSNLITQTKVSGIIVDKLNKLFLCKCSFKGSNERTVSNEDGRFILNQ
jgi:hypothetical protein